MSLPTIQDLRLHGVSIVAPLAGASIFVLIKTIADYVKGDLASQVTVVYIAESAIIASAGALISAAFFAARSLILFSSRVDRHILQVPWCHTAASAKEETAKLDIAMIITKIYEKTNSSIGAPEARLLALDALHSELRCQLNHIEAFGRLQFVSPNPSDAHYFNLDADASERLAFDGYALVAAYAKRNDAIIATEFGNSNLWLLRKDIYLNYMSFNIDLLRKGVSIRRIFGTNRMEWSEDDDGVKKAVIQLEANIKGMEVFTVDYSDFSKTSRFGLEELDMLIPIRNGVPLPGVEWEIDGLGQVQKVFHVFGEQRLAKLRDAFDGIIKSGRLGSSLRRVEPTQCLDPLKSTDTDEILNQYSSLLSIK